MMLESLLDIPARIRYRLRGNAPDYREFLFAELKERLADKVPLNILEIGPRDGVDTARLLSLDPQSLVLVDLPDKEERVRGWMEALNAPALQLIIGNMMYDEACAALGDFDVVWCTGVLYHNPEQLRMVRRLYDFVRPGGLLAIESATARRPRLRDENCVEIWHGVDKSVHRQYHVSKNITHLPSRLAIRSWLEMVGFEDVYTSTCHRKITRGLAAHRAAFVARRPLADAAAGYYSFVGLNYDIGKAS